MLEGDLSNNPVIRLLTLTREIPTQTDQQLYHLLPIGEILKVNDFKSKCQSGKLQIQ
jgi:hypothetical protein